MNEREQLEYCIEQNKKILMQQKIILVLLLVLIVFLICFLFLFLQKMNKIDTVLNKIKDIDFDEITDAMKNINKVFNYFNY